MANTIEYAKIFQDELDKQMVVGSTSGWMEPNAKNVKYDGGNEVKVPIIDMDGLGDYDRNDGFVDGSVSLQYKTMTMTMDRGRSFQLDAMDVNETNFVLAAGNVIGEFQSTKVIPEIDAYRYSKIAAEAAKGSRITTGFTPTAENVLTQLRQDIYEIWDEIGDSVSLVISMSTLVAKLLDNSAELQKMLGVTDFKKGEVNMKVTSLDDIPIIKVPSARMKTEYLFKSGGAGQEEGGFAPSSTAKNINWLITARSVPTAIAKTDKIRIFVPDTSLKADVWKIDFRKYHDCWIMPNKVNGIWANTK